MFDYLRLARNEHRERWRAMLALLLAPLLLVATCTGYQALWWRGAEAAIAATVPARDFREPYELTGVDNELTGTSLMDLLSPGVLIADARFRNGHTYHVEARRIRQPGHRCRDSLVGVAMRIVPTRAAEPVAPLILTEAEQTFHECRTLADLLRWAAQQFPVVRVAEIVTQDEYTHDVVLPFGSAFLSFDTT